MKKISYTQGLKPMFHLILSIIQFVAHVITHPLHTQPYHRLTRTQTKTPVAIGEW